jgi:hypothetical protein
VNFDSAAVPSQTARQSGRNEHAFRDPATEMPVIDWHLFYNELVPDTMEVFLRAAKEASDFKKSAGAFYRYMFEFGGDPDSSSPIRTGFLNNVPNINRHFMHNVCCL